MKICAFVTSLLSLALTCVVCGASADYGPLLQKIAAKHDVPGMALVVLRGDRIIAQGVAGVRKLGSPEKITLDDQFHLGSDSKAMTATLIGLLVDSGTVEWTTTLGEIFGDVAQNMRPEWRTVTLQQVLEHRGGFPPNTDPKKRRRNYPSAPVADLRWAFVTETLSQPPEYPPGTKYEYSNTGYIVLGAVIDRLSGNTWEDAITERLFAPLGITSGGFGAPGVAGKLDQPRGHLASGPSIEPGPSADNPAFYGPAGTVHMAIRDWAKFATLHLRGDPANPHRNVRILQAETFAHLHFAPNGYMGGWGILTDPGAKGTHPGDVGRVLSHDGSNTLWYCAALLAPEIDFAVLVCANKGDEKAARACHEATSAMIAEFRK